MRDFWAGMGLVLVIEGLLYGGFPAMAKRMAAQMLATPENVLRIVGLAAMATGVGVIWAARQ